MIQALPKQLTFDEFLNWDDGTDKTFELIDGIPMPISEPNANHNVNKEIFRGVGRVYVTYLQALKLLANPPLQLIANGARSQKQPTLFVYQLIDGEYQV